MAMKDYTARMGLLLAMEENISTTTEAVSDELDVSRFNSVTFAIRGKYSASDAAVINFKLQHSEDGVTYTDVQEDQMNNVQPLSFAAPMQKIGYVGGRKFVKLVAKADKAFTSQSCDVTAIAVLLEPDIIPVN